MARRAYDRAYGRTELDETFSRAGWRGEVDTYYRQRKSVWLVLAGMVVMSAFWTNPWAWVAMFWMLALYSALVGVRVGVIVGISWATWFVVLIERWVFIGSWGYRAFGLWCIATLFLLVVWKQDGGALQLKDRGGGSTNAPHD